MDKSQTRTKEGDKYFKCDSFDSVITDAAITGEDGLPLMRRIKELDEILEVVILNGFATPLKMLWRHCG